MTTTENNAAPSGLTKERIAAIAAEFYDAGDGDTEHGCFNLDGFAAAIALAAAPKAAEQAGQEPIYQIRLVSGEWVDVTEKAYFDQHPSVTRRIVLAAPLPRASDAESVELPARVIDQLFQTAGVSTYHPDGDQQDKLHAFARAVVAETLARIPSRASDADRVNLDGWQLLEALNYLAPDRETDPDQLNGDVTIQFGKGHSGEALYCWSGEYPEDGAFVLDGSTVDREAFAATPKRASDAAAPTLLGSPAEGHWGEPETPSDGHKLESDVEQEAHPDERAAWDSTRHSLAVAISAFVTRPEGNRGLDAAVQMLDAITESGSPLAWLRATAPQAEQRMSDAARESAIERLVAAHAGMLDSNPYCYFELAYTRQTDWMAWVTDRPARGEPGTTEYAKSRKVIVRGQGPTAEEACADAMSLIDAARKAEIERIDRAGGEAC